MKSVIILALTIVLVGLGAVIGPVSAQQVQPPPPLQVQPTQQSEQQLTPVPTPQPDQQPPPQSGPGSLNQWLSHQMNQPPPPPTSDRQKVSQDRIDEIQQLYEQARKEAEAKAKKPVPDTK